MPKKGQKFNNYDREFVMQVVTEKLTTDLSYADLSNKYGIPSGTISGWVYKHTTKAWDFSDSRGRKSTREIDYKMRYEIVKKYLAFLQQQHQSK